MKIQVRSSFNGLVQEVDISMAGCGGLCPAPPAPPAPIVSFTLVNGVYNGPAGHIESEERLGSYYGAGPGLENTLVWGYFLSSPVSNCSIEPPGQDTARIELLFFEGQLLGAFFVRYDPVTGRYFLIAEGTLPQNVLITLGNYVCNPPQV